jgi:hypothetical protein
MVSLRQRPADGDTSPEAMARLAKHNQQVLEVIEEVNRLWVVEEAAAIGLPQATAEAPSTPLLNDPIGAKGDSRAK